MEEKNFKEKYEKAKSVIGCIKEGSSIYLEVSKILVRIVSTFCS